MTDTMLMRDITLGVLVIVFSAFIMYFAWYMTNYIPFLSFVVALVAAWVARIACNVGWLFIKGIYISNDIP